MIDNLTVTLLNMTNTTTNSPNSSSDSMPWYIPVVCVGFWGSVLLARKAYEAMRDGRCDRFNPCGLFRDYTTPANERTYIGSAINNLDPAAAAALAV